MPEKRKCEPCHAGTPPLTESERAELLQGLKGWSIEDNRLIKSFALKDFMGPMEMANKVAALAEELGHHPDLHVRWGELKVVIWTHKIDNLSQADFVLAEEIEALN